MNCSITWHKHSWYSYSPSDEICAQTCTGIKFSVGSDHCGNMHGRGTVDLGYGGSLAAKTMEEQMPKLGNRGLKDTATKWTCFRHYEKRGSRNRLWENIKVCKHFLV